MVYVLEIKVFEFLSNLSPLLVRNTLGQYELLWSPSIPAAAILAPGRVATEQAVDRRSSSLVSRGDL